MENACINDKIDIFPREDGNAEIFNRFTKKSYLIGQNEYNVLRALDGTKTYEQLSKLSKVYSPETIKALISKFEKIGLIKNKEVKEKLNILKIRMRVMNPNKSIDPNNILIKLLYIAIVYLSIPIFIIGLLFSLYHTSSTVSVIQSKITTPSALLILPFSLVVLALHELGHAITARCNKVNVPEFGVMLYWFLPCAYTNLNGIVFVEKKSKRLLILFGGILVNLGLSGLSLIWLRFSKGMGRELLLWFSLSNITICFTNLLLFLKYDGYYILEEFLQVKNLREKSFKYLRDLKTKNQLTFSNESFRGEIIEDTDKFNLLDGFVFFMTGLFSTLYIPVIIISILMFIISLF